MEIISKIFKRITAGSLLAFGATFQNLAIWKRDNASEMTFFYPSTWTALNCILLHIVNKTKGRTNFITLLDFDVLLLIIVTKALLSVLNKILFPSNFNVQVNKARTMGTNSKRVISLIISEPDQFSGHFHWIHSPPK